MCLGEEICASATEHSMTLQRAVALRTTSCSDLTSRTKTDKFVAGTQNNENNTRQNINMCKNAAGSQRK